MSAEDLVVRIRLRFRIAAELITVRGLHTANVHLDLAISNFGVQEARVFSQVEQDVFPGCHKLKDGYYWANDKPGLGIDLDEKLAAKFPITDDPPFDFRWGNDRRKDGSVVKP